MLLDNWVIVENNGTKDDYKTHTHIISSPLPKKGNEWLATAICIYHDDAQQVKFGSIKEVQSAELWTYTQKSDLGFNRKYTVEELPDTSDLQL